MVGSLLLEMRVGVFSVWKGHPDSMALPEATLKDRAELEQKQTSS